MIENSVKAVIVGSCFALVMILFNSMALASYCIDNDTLAGNITIDGSNHSFIKYCENGCEDNSCTPSELSQYLIIIGVVVCIIIIIMLLKKSGAIR